MSREQLIRYIVKYAETLELKVLLNSFDELRKGIILNEEMTETLNEIETQLKEDALKDSQQLKVGQEYLKKLEGRILMLMIIQSMARDHKNKKRLFSCTQQITALFTEYILEGGKRSFRSPGYRID